MQSPHNPNFILIHMFPSHHGGQCLSALPVGAVDSLKVGRKKISRVAHCGDHVCRGSARWGNCSAGCCPFLVLSGITGRSPFPSSLSGWWSLCMVSSCDALTLSLMRPCPRPTDEACCVLQTLMAMSFLLGQLQDPLTHLHTQRPVTHRGTLSQCAEAQ